MHFGLVQTYPRWLDSDRDSTFAISEIVGQARNDEQAFLIRCPAPNDIEDGECNDVDDGERFGFFGSKLPLRSNLN
ncbi:MAG: hypothetical protein Q8908_12580 [Bacteroidota bacterium]|nr:hypothetical protein [Bacteroidota bacterium]